MKWRKKISVCILAGVLLTGCGAKTEDNHETVTSGPEITISEIRETNHKLVSQKKHNIRDTGYTSLIDNSVVSMIKSDADELVGRITDSDENITVEKEGDGIAITTENEDQRDAIIDILNNYIDGFIEDTKAGSHIKISYDIRNGYVDIYCGSENADAVQEMIDNIAGYIAFGQEIADNESAWGITIVINDSETGATVVRGNISDEDSFALSADDWNSPVEEQDGTESESESAIISPENEEELPESDVNNETQPAEDPE